MAYIQKLYASVAEGKYSDMELVCDDKHFKVHSIIVLSQSEVLTVAVDGSFEVRLSLFS